MKNVAALSPALSPDEEVALEREALQREESSESFIDFAPKFLAIDDPPIEYIIPELTPRAALKCSHGDPRTMKSLAALEEAIAASTGTSAFGLERFRPNRKYSVLYSSQEDAAPIVRARARKMLRGRGIVEFPDTLAFAVHKGINFDTPEWCERFFTEVTALGFELVIIDPIRSFTSHADKGPADVMPVAKFFRRLIVQGIAVHIVHNDTKPPSNGQDMRRRSHRTSGGGWFAVSECPVSFEKIADQKTLVSPEDYKFSADPRPFTIGYAEDETGIRLTGEDSTATEAQTLATDEAIMGYLADHPGASGRTITKAIRKGHAAVTDSLERLFNANKVDCADLGPGKGKRWTGR